MESWNSHGIQIVMEKSWKIAKNEQKPGKVMESYDQFCGDEKDHWSNLKIQTELRTDSTKWLCLKQCFVIISVSFQAVFDLEKVHVLLSMYPYPCYLTPLFLPLYSCHHAHIHML